MAKKKQAVEDQAQEDSGEPKRHVMIGVDGVNINGHHLKEGHVVQLTEAEIAQHRDAGVPLHDVDENTDIDEGTLIDVSQPYVVPEEDDDDGAE